MEDDLVLNQINLNKTKNDKCKLSLIQFDLNKSKESKQTEKDEFLNYKEKNAHTRRRIFNFLQKSVKNNAKIIIFPEVTIPRNLINEMMKFASENHVYIICGLEYDKKYRNSSMVITPSGESFQCPKKNKSKYDSPKMRSGNYLNLYINTGFGDFAVLVCYDFTDSKILESIRNYVDMIFVIANNPAKRTFKKSAETDGFRTYSYIAIANTAEFGLSCVYAPHKNPSKRLLGSLGIQNKNKPIERPLYRDVDVNLFKDEIFRKPAAGYKRKKLPLEKPNIHYSMIDWPHPFAENSIIIIGDTYHRAITDLAINNTERDKMKKILPKYFKILNPYIPKKDHYNQARTIDTLLIGKLSSKLFENSYNMQTPEMYLDSMVIDKKKSILSKYNIITIGTPEVNKISKIVNHSLEYEQHSYVSALGDKLDPLDVRLGHEGRPILEREGLARTGIIGLTKNPYNNKKLAMMIGGVQWIGTLACMKFLIENEGEVFVNSKYGLAVKSSRKISIKDWNYEKMDVKVIR